MIQVSAPGSLMLLGEHAVLSGCRALLVAHKARIRVALFLEGEGPWVKSDLHGSFDLRSPETPPSFSFVKKAFEVYQDHLPPSLTVTIESDFSDQLGLGSSAAVTVATLGVFWAYLNPEKNFDEISRQFLWEQAKDVILKAQGIGSGADAATSLWGGVVLHNPVGRSTKQIKESLPLVAVYSGAKRKTSEIVHLVEKRFEFFPELWNSFLGTSEQLVQRALKAIAEENLETLGKIFDIAQGLMDSYGVNSPILAELIFKLRQTPTIWGAKISGSGLGDCVIGLGGVGKEEKELFDPFPIFPIVIDSRGIIRETF